MTEQRRHFKQALNLKQRLLDRVRSLRDEANSMNPGLERDTEAGQMDKILKAIRDHHEPYVMVIRKRIYHEIHSLAPVSPFLGFRLPHCKAR